MDSLIRWKRSDYMKLSHAVRKFNNLITSLDVDERNYLPNLKDYQDLKDHITTRKELNRILNSLRRGNIENLTNTLILESGEKISKYEWKELNLAKRRGLKNLQRERERILETRPSIGMGDERLSEIKAIEESFQKVQVKTGADFKRLKTRIFAVGRSDYELSKAELFRKNFYTALEGIKNFENYDKLKKALDKIKNPEKFYEYVSKSPTLMDLFLWYKEPETLFYGAFTSNQEAFDSSLFYHLGIEDIEM